MIHVYASFFETESSGRTGTPDKTNKAGNMHDREHQVGRDLLCRGLWELYGLEADAVPPFQSAEHNDNKQIREEIPFIESLLEKGPQGKPFLKDYLDIHFNISHCRGLAVCAFSDRPVGVDVEEVKQVRDPLIRRVLHKNEIEELSRFGEIREKSPGESVERNEEFLNLFFRYWTLKESYLKQDGCGLTREPREICFDVDPEEWDGPVFCSDPHVVSLQSRISLRSREHENDYVLSVCCPYSAETNVPDSIPEMRLFWA